MTPPVVSAPPGHWDLREGNLNKLGKEIFDALIVGAGINGAVSAIALAARGARVALLDRGDFAGCTSQQSSSLIWGGIKYLESYDFALVRKLCKSRNLLLQSYPSRVREIRFLTTVPRGFRHRPVVLWLGAWLYWLMGGGFTAPPRLLSRQQLEREEKIIDLANALGGVEYSDAFLPDGDARFVFDFVRGALDCGCVAANYVESLGADRVGNIWYTRARDVIGGGELTVRSKLLINATGPFVDTHNRLTGQRTEHHHVLSKGIHLIVEPIPAGRRVLTFFADDGRLFFAIPMAGKTCIGTTDTRVENPFVGVTDEDRRFVLGNINRHLKLAKPLARDDIVAERCGVRPLVVKGSVEVDTDWLQLSRKHALEVNPQGAHISIFGGKLTDCINIGNEISTWVRRLGIKLSAPNRKWYGEPDGAVRERYLQQVQRLGLEAYNVPQAADTLTERWWRRYGGAALELLAAIRNDPRAADVLIAGTGSLRCEIHQARQREMIVKLEDYLRRRTPIAQVVRQEILKRSPGLMEACEILFAEKAVEKWQEYFQEDRVAPYA